MRTSRCVATRTACAAGSASRRRRLGRTPRRRRLRGIARGGLRRRDRRRRDVRAGRQRGHHRAREHRRTMPGSALIGGVRTRGYGRRTGIARRDHFTSGRWRVFVRAHGRACRGDVPRVREVSRVIGLGRGQHERVVRGTAANRDVAQDAGAEHRHVQHRSRSEDRDNAAGAAHAATVVREIDRATACMTLRDRRRRCSSSTASGSPGRSARSRCATRGRRQARSSQCG